MFKPGIRERTIHKIKIKTRKFTAPLKRRKLNNTDFSIISNNCWGGLIYEEYGLRKNSPTIGCYFFAEDYIKLVKNLKYYLSLELKIVTSAEAVHKQWIIENGNKDAIIGVLDDIEIIFVHYKEPEVVCEKWTKRVQRINWNNLIFKFSLQNHASLQHLQEFDEAELPGKKVMYVNSKNFDYKCGVYYPGFEEDGQINNDTFYGTRFFDVSAFINEGILRQQKTKISRGI